MQQRTLTITVDANACQALRACAVAAFQADGYLGETLNFETPGAFFGRLTERRWAALIIIWSKTLQVDQLSGFYCHKNNVLCNLPKICRAGWTKG